MARERQLKNAPIAEAIIDIRASLPDDFVPESLAGARDALANDFPLMEERHGAEFAQSLDPKNLQVSGQAKDLGILGYFYWAADRSALAQMRVDGFTFNLLNNYESWEELIRRAQAAWNLYLEYAKPIHVSRVATRFINKLQLPGSCRNLDRYLVSPPTTPEGLPNTVKSFLCRVVFDNLPRDAEAQIVTSSSPALSDDEFGLVIDIDAYEIGDFDPYDGEVFAALNELRKVKNKAFFNSITEDTAGIYQ